MERPIAEIDLHGCTKSEAIQRLTAFLDEVSRQSKISSQPLHQRQSSTSNSCWVSVITGSGAHSSYGPVLRTAVEELFQKRQMQYLINRGKGGFTANANSGIVFFEPAQPIDSKVVITSIGAGGRASLSYASILSKHRDRVRGPPGSMKSEPLPFEVAASDAAMEESRIDADRTQADDRKEKHQLEKVLSMSALQQKKEEEEEAQLMQQAMSLSLIEGGPKENENEKEELQKAIMASQNDEEEKRREQEREEELMLQKVLSMSVLEKRNEKDEEEEMLQKASSRSKMEDEATCSSSEHSHFQDGDQELEEALKASMKDCSTSQTHYDCDYDHSPNQVSDHPALISHEKEERLYKLLVSPNPGIVPTKLRDGTTGEIGQSVV